MTPSRSFASLALASLVLSAASLARAETAPEGGPSCRTPVFSFSSGDTLPANVLAFPVRPGDASSFELVGPAQEKIALDLVDDPALADPMQQLLVPASKPAEGAWKLAWTTSCAPALDGEVPLTVGADQELPTTIGTLEAKHETSWMQLDLDHDGKYEQMPVDSVRFELASSPAFRSYAPLAILVAAADAPPSPDAGGYGGWPGLPKFSVFTDVIPCGGDPNVDGGGLARTVHVIAHVAGADADPTPLAFPYTAECTDAGAPPGDAGPDVDQPGDGGSSPDGSTADAGPAPAPAAPAEAPEGDGGCSVSRGAPRGSLLAPLAALVAIGARLRRRSGAPDRSVRAG